MDSDYIHLRITFSEKNKTLRVTPTFHTAGQTKVTNLDSHSRGEEHISKFEITMKESLGMYVVHSQYDLSRVVTNFPLTQCLPVLGHME